MIIDNPYLETDQTKALEAKVMAFVQKLFREHAFLAPQVISSSRNIAISKFAFFMTTFTEKKDERALQQDIMHFLAGDPWIVGLALKNPSTELIMTSAKHNSYSDFWNDFKEIGYSKTDFALAKEGFNVYQAGKFSFMDRKQARELATTNGQLRLVRDSVFNDEEELHPSSLW